MCRLEDYTLNFPLFFWVLNREKSLLNFWWLTTVARCTKTSIIFIFKLKTSLVMPSKYNFSIFFCVHGWKKKYYRHINYTRENEKLVKKNFKIFFVFSIFHNFAGTFQLDFPFRKWKVHSLWWNLFWYQKSAQLPMTGKYQKSFHHSCHCSSPF